MLSPTLLHEIDSLAERYGTPLRQHAVLRGAPFTPLNSTDRVGEVCMVVRRRNGKLLTATKTFYPPDTFRLLTGGIHHGEGIEAALLREVHEETGLSVVVQRFLAWVEYRLAEPNNPSFTFVTLAFLVDEVSGELGAHDEAEQVAAFREVAVDELPLLAQTLEDALEQYDHEIHGSWSDWGRFRAVIHHAVYAGLRSTDEAAP
jgi:8-oxo-dGTP pyrophosphatase MutT (NUDIX family)